MKSYIKHLKYILPALLLVLVTVLFFKLSPAYKDIQKYNQLKKNYRAVEFEFYSDEDNPILKDKKYKDYREKEKFVREYNKLSNEIKQSPGIEKVKKIYKYLHTRFISKKDYLEKDRYVMFLAKDSTYSDPVFKCLSQLKMEKENIPWKVADSIENDFFKNHYLVEFLFTGYNDDYAPLSSEGYDIVNNRRIVAINKETLIAHELSDFRGDWLKYNYFLYEKWNKKQYDRFDKHEEKIRAFNEIVKNENIQINDKETVKKYLEFLICIYYREASDIFNPKYSTYPSRHNWLYYINASGLDIQKEDDYYTACFYTEGARWIFPNNRADFEEFSKWNVKIYKSGEIETKKEIITGGSGYDVMVFISNKLEEKFNENNRKKKRK